MVTKSLENLLKNAVARGGFKNNARWYYLGKNKPIKEEYNDEGETPSGRRKRQYQIEENANIIEGIGQQPTQRKKRD